MKIIVFLSDSSVVQLCKGANVNKMFGYYACMFTKLLSILLNVANSKLCVMTYDHMIAKVTVAKKCTHRYL